MAEVIPLPDTGSLRADLSIFLHESAVFLESPAGRLLTRSMFATMKHEESHIRQVYWQTRISHTSALFQRAIARGEVAPETDACVVVTALIGALYVRLLVLNAPLDQPFLDQLASMVLHGVTLR